MLKLLQGTEFPGAPDAALQRQPAGFDLTVASVGIPGSDGALDLTNANRLIPELINLAWPADGPLVLHPGGYVVTYNEEVAVPLDCAAIVLPRSSLMRCGAVLHSALWDPGYKGRGQGLLTVFNDLSLYPNARIGQIVFLALERNVDEGYQGQYQGENIKS